MSKKKNKHPIVKELPHTSKQSIANIDPNLHLKIKFTSNMIEMDGPFSWSNFEGRHVKEFLDLIFHAQSSTWADLGSKGCHEVNFDKMSPKAQKHVRNTSLDEEAIFYSLRIRGKFRCWSIKEGHNIHLLWWDPDHEVCPSNLKHT